MTCSIYFVTPCGGTHAEAQTTADSVIDVCRQMGDDVRVVHFFVFNNSLTPEIDLAEAPANYESQVIELGTLASRAAARNAGLDAVANKPAGIVCFLDAGDRLLNSSAIDLARTTVESFEEKRLWAFSAAIIGRDIRSIRKPRPLRMRRINNPFLIGATYATTSLATSNRFVEGSKEDWKYWLGLLDAVSPENVTLHDEVAYEYQVVSTSDHLRRKRPLLRDQYRFFSEYLGYGHGLRTTFSMIAHIMIAGTAWLRRSTRFQPWRRSP